MSTAITSTSNEYLSTRRYFQYPITSGYSSTKFNKSIKNALLGIWQELNTEELHLSSSTPTDSRYFEEYLQVK